MKEIDHLLHKCLAVVMFFATLGFGACFEDIDDSDLYTFTGETIEDYLANRPEQFSSFNYILSRTGYDKILSSYGVYTCFAPDNEAVQNYIDSLYDDETNLEIPHNGMTQRGLEGLSDSLCLDIALYHLLYTKVLSVNMSRGATLNTILRRDINTTTDSLGVAINVNTHLLANMDIELENGVLHEIDRVFTRSNNMVSGELSMHPEFSIFYQALVATGLSDSLLQTERTGIVLPESDIYRNQATYIPEGCKVGFTLFAEDDAVLAKNGIYSLEDLIDYAKSVYASCAKVGSGWYHYYRNNGIEVSTRSDYTSSNNVLNMFVRYHMIKASIPMVHLAYAGEANAKDSRTPAVNYFETMLPYTLMRVSQEGSNRYVINIWKSNSTLTDEVGTLGKPGFHEVLNPGVDISNVQIDAFNGYIHPVNDMLVYNSDAVSCLNERLRFDDSAFFYELLNNKFRHMSTSELGNLNPGGANDMIRIPDGYCENLIIYNGDDSQVRYMPQEMDGDKVRWYSWEGDELNVQGKYDIAMRIPPVPDGNYEIRMGYQAIGGTGTGNRGMMQIFLGDGTYDVNSMVPLDIPLDMRHRPAPDGNIPDVKTGWVDPGNTADQGVETDNTMRYLGYMRGPMGMIVRGGGSARNQAGTIRRILAKVTLHQGEYWLRFKSVLEDTTPMLHLDYLELVPEDVYNNETYTEDMY